MDYFTKGLEAIPMADQEASTVSEAMVEILLPVLEFKLYFPQVRARISFRLFAQNFTDILVYSKLEQHSDIPSLMAWLIYSYFIEQF